MGTHDLMMDTVWSHIDLAPINQVCWSKGKTDSINIIINKSQWLTIDN